MGKGSQNVARDRDDVWSWEEVRKHTSKDDQWIVIEDIVYDISNWAKRHPGGSRVISHYAGQDATEPFRAFHIDPDFVRKYMKPIRVGRVQDQDMKEEEIKKDFEEVRQKAIAMGLFKPSWTFFFFNMLHVIVLEVVAYMIMSYYGTGWLPYLASAIIFSTVQAQAGWTQHDYGHLSVFSTAKLNYIVHQFIMGFTKGASVGWWQHLHNQHHAKPNVLYKDPDVRLEAVLVLGETMPKRLAQQKKKLSMPYNWQHRYFFAIWPPLLFPLYFQIMVFRHAITRRQWLDLGIMCLFYIKFTLLYMPMLGFWALLKFYFFIRFIESHWFVWVTQSNHIPMEIDDDKFRSWVPLQLYASCNIEGSVFNDWFTGHLNYQIEHHLFPCMPRHNLYKTTDMCKKLCEKHGIPFEIKSIYRAFSDIPKSLEHSGKIWALNRKKTHTN